MTRLVLGLRVGQAHEIGALSEGMDLMLPNFAAGRPAFGARLTSPTLAAMRLYQIGSPRRGEGAINGAQLRMQDEYAASYGFSPHDLGPRNLGAAANNPFTGAAGMHELTQAIRQLTQAITGNGPIRSQRPGEASGKLGGALDSRAGNWGWGNEAYN